MRKSTRSIALALVCLAAFVLQKVSAQSILDPTDPIVNYNSSAPKGSATNPDPVYGPILKWVRTPRMAWSTTSWKSYYYRGNAFRLKFPKSYNPTANDGKKYPMLIFFHGLGEAATIYDNEYQLLHGGQYFTSSVDNGTFDGYIITMQTISATSGFWSDGQYQSIKEIIDYMVANNKLDPFRIVDNGLSAGGMATWDFMIKYPQYISAAVPMSSAAGRTRPGLVDSLKYTPMWVTHGGLDNNPTPYDAQQTNLAMQAQGANYKDQIYPNLGHGVWDNTWAEKDFWPFVKRAYSSNPWPAFGRTDFCPGESFNVTLGLAFGFDGYEWRKDGVLIPGANSRTLSVTTLGTYSARVLRNGIWSDWSPTPVVIKLKTATIPPPIEMSETGSKVLPALDGTTSIQLEIPAGYTSYQWQKEGNPATLSTTRFLTATSGGDYKVKVSEAFGCSSQFSTPFRVVDANGYNKPDAAVSLVATTLGNSSLRLDWSDNPTPQYNETGFEIYQGTSSGGPYKFLGLTAADIRKFTVTGLTPNTTYYYKVRAVNETSGSAASNEANATTLADTKMPTAPVIAITNITSSSVTLDWNPSTDDGGISKYEIYVNGVKSYVTTGTEFTVTGLPAGDMVYLTVIARDLANNPSAVSNQVTAIPSLGLSYKQYVYTGSWTNLPDFGTLNPAATGRMANTFITPRTAEDRFAFLWEGYIEIPVTGTYYFRTNSDDGSRLWLGALNGTGSPYSFSGTPTVNNDGLHGPQDRTSALLNLTAGVYPIAIAFYDETGGQSFTLTWKTPSSGANFVAIPNMAFTDRPAGLAPNKPSNLIATPIAYNRIDLSWTDNSANETAFEIYRSTDPYNNFLPIGRVAGNVKLYQDNGLSPNVKYYYRVKAINNFGESDFDLPGQGVDYSYYQLTGLTALPTFTQTPVKTGRVANFDLGAQEQADNFQFKFSSIIDIPADGVYTFYLRSDEGSKLYLDAFDAAHVVIDNDNKHTVAEKSAGKYLAKGQHTIFVTYFEVTGAEELGVYISSADLVKQKIPANMLGTPLACATTPASSIAPARPTTMLATGSSTTSINLTWQDKSSNETGFELYRSTGNNSAYVLYATLPANTTTYTDANLFTNGIYYYKLRAVGINNNSGYTNEDSAKTFNVIPVITNLADRTAKFGVSTVIPIVATDGDGDPLTFTAQNLPSFVSLVDNGNKTATLTINPTAADQGVYNNIQVRVADNHAGVATTTFNLTVNANSDPVLSTVPDYSLTENTSLNIPLSATDAEGQAITFAVSNVPQGFSLVPGSNGNATLQLTPNAQAAGSYPVTVTATDAAGGTSATVFNLTINDGAPAAPALLNARFVYGQGVRLTWTDASTNETGFQIFRSTSPNSGFAQIGTLNTPGATTYTDNTVAGNLQYYYTVKAVTANDASNASNTAAAFTNRIPQLTALSNISLKTNQSSTVSLTATDDATDVIKLSATGLPSFATLTDAGGGNGSIAITPNAGSPGVYVITVTAKDKYDSTSSSTFELSVVDKDVNSVYVNFTDGSVAAGKPWVNFVQAHTGLTLSNIQDDSYTNSGISVKVQDGWDFTNATGVRGGNGAGREIYPDEVMLNAMQFGGTNSHRIVISGLSSSKRYNVVFFNSYMQDRDVTTQYTIGTQTVTLNGKFNTNKTVQINGLVPDGNGQILVDISKPAGSTAALLNAMVIQSYTNALAPLSPAGLRAVRTTRNSVSLQWQDRSDEGSNASTDGFEVYRYNAGSYTKIATLGQNVTSYTENNLNAGTTYYYAVKSKRSSTLSAFSNVVAATTSNYSVSVNFNYTTAGQGVAPWNNTDLEPLESGYVWNNFLDDLGAVSAVGMVNTGKWGGPSNGGSTTGANSGPVPDVVMKESYGVFPGLPSLLKLTGLNVSRKYNLTFFASVGSYDNLTATYTVNGQFVNLNSSFNTSGTVTLYDLVPDENGELNLSVSAASGAFAAFIGALTIQEVNPSAAAAPPTSGRIQIGVVNLAAGTDPQTEGKSTAYPNPYRQSLTVVVPAQDGDKLTLTMYDLSGKVVYQGQFNQLMKGLNPITVNTAANLAPGTYFIKVQMANRKESQLIKVIRQ